MRSVGDDRTVQMWLNTELDTEFVLILLQESAQAMQPVEIKKSPTDIDQDGDNYV